MALQFNYETDTGLILPEAYVHIASFQGNKLSMDLQVSIFKDKLARDADKRPIGMLNMRIELAGGATYTQMYTELKKQELFASSIDI